MKGVILAGGLGTRLRPLTYVTNKHLLPVYDRPMIYYPLVALVNAGITDILIVTGGGHATDFRRLIGDGKSFGAERVQFAYQQGEGGIADALKLAESFAGREKICVLLGDNIFESSLHAAAERFAAQSAGARVLLKEVEDPRQFGVARFATESSGGPMVEVMEKPPTPPSNLAVVGAYFFDARVFDICRDLRPSVRGELEITDVLNAYIAAGELEYETLDGWWADAGTFEGLNRAAALIAEGAKEGTRVSGAPASSSTIPPAATAWNPPPSRWTALQARGVR